MPFSRGDPAAYGKGRRAYSEGKNPSDNPYANELNRRDWTRGWRDACRNDPLLDEDEIEALLATR